jgi:NodT family efflux transporter outer membrane factor (OMF) lipoprotein
MRTVLISWKFGLQSGLFIALAMSCSGCTSLSEYVQNGFKVGPNYQMPDAPVAPNWIDASDKRVRTGSDDLSKWWTVFNDPVLNDLIYDAYHQNLTLREAGYRVLQARAQLGISIGELFPQTQSMNGDFLREASNGATGTNQKFINRWDYGFALAWELDFWGKFRRTVESNRASLQASVANYDDVLVTLLGDLATAYVQYRTTEERIRYATQNANIQAQVLEIVRAQFAAGKIPKMDVDQAESTLYQTQAGIPALEIALRTYNNQMCLLLGIPTVQLQGKLGKAPIPVAPVDVAIGIPADLLRRRPDVREAERLAAAQCAQIGLAVSAYYPHISILGTIDYQANRFKDLFNGKSFSGSIGPSFQWDILQYGRLLNNVRMQDANYLQLVEAYRQAVLTANQEVENGLVTFLKSQEQYQLQKKSVDAGKAALDTVQKLYPDKVDFTRVAQLLQTQVVLEDTLAQVQGQIATGLISVYQAMGGGWEIRLTEPPGPLVDRQKLLPPAREPYPPVMGEPVFPAPIPPSGSAPVLPAPQRLENNEIPPAKGGLLLPGSQRPESSQIRPTSSMVPPVVQEPSLPVSPRPDSSAVEWRRANLGP